VAAASIVTVASAKQVIAYADAWLTVTNKLVNHVKVNEQLADVQERVFNIAQQTRSSLEATATLYGRLSAATGEFIKNGETVGDLVSNINRAMQVSGATTAEAEGALVQLSQAFGAGALRGEEFNSVNEAAPRLMKALADSLGVARGALKQMAADGKLTTEVLYKAWGGQSKAAMEIQNEFQKMTATSAAKLQVANNNLTKWIGTNKTAVSVAKSYGDSAIYLSESLDSIANASILLAGVAGGRLTGSMVAATAATLSSTSASTANAIAKVAEAKAVALVAAEQLASTSAAITQQRISLQSAIAAKDRSIQSVIAARAIQSQAAAELELATASVASARLEAQRLGSTTVLTSATDRLSIAKKASTLATAELATAEKIASSSSVTLATAKQASTVAISESVIAKRASSVASAQLATANKGLALSSRLVATASRGASAAMALVGGPVGVAVLAASAIAYYYATAETAAEKSKNLAEEVDNLAASFSGLTSAQRAVQIAKLNTEMRSVREELILANEALQNWTETAKTDPFARQKVQEYQNTVENLTEKLDDLSVKQQAVFNSGLPTLTTQVETVDFGPDAANPADDKARQRAADKLQSDKDDAAAYLETLRQANFNELELIDTQEMEKSAKLQEYRDLGLVSEQEYQDALNDIITTAVLGRAEIGNSTLDKEGEKQDEARRDATKAEAAAAKAKEKIIDDGIEGQRNMTADLKASLGEQSAAYKASAIATTIINTFQSAQGAFTAMASIPYVGPALGVAAAAAAVAAGMANVQAIKGAREQGGYMQGGSPYQMAERGKAEVIVPAGNSIAKTASQMRDIMGQSGGGGVTGVTIVNNTTGRVDNATTEMDNEGMLHVIIDEYVSAALLTQDSSIAKARKASSNQPGF
jgi:tape measure domain-containing protein